MHFLVYMDVCTLNKVPRYALVYFADKPVPDLLGFWGGGGVLPYGFPVFCHVLITRLRYTISLFTILKLSGVS